MSKKAENIINFLISLVIFVLVWTGIDWLYCKFITHSVFTFDWPLSLTVGTIVCLVTAIQRAKRQKKAEVEGKKENNK